MRRRLAIACLATASVLLCAAPVATATAPPSARSLLAGVSRLNDELALLGQGSSGLGFSRNRALSELRFENRDGYTIAVLAFGQTVALSVTHKPGDDRGGHGRISTATYLAHGKVTPTSIAASFGERGRIAVRFQPSGRDVHATRKAGCKESSDGTLAHLGVFAGELRFQGEGGYTAVEVHRVHGRSVDYVALLACLLGSPSGRHTASPAQKAKPGQGLPGFAATLQGQSQGVPSVPTHPSDGPKSTTLVADSKAPLARTVFAARMKDGRPAHFVAANETSEGPIGILRMVVARAAPSTFAFDDTLAGATVKPPRPFAGVGTLEHGPGVGKSWTGSLTVSFLGAPRVPLTEAPFIARLARGF